MSPEIDRREEQQNNLRAAEALYAAFNQGDLATLVRLLDESIEVDVVEPAGEAGSFQGHKGFGRWYEKAGGHKLQVTDVVPVGASRIVVAAPGGADVVELSDGKVVAIRVYAGKETALEAARTREADAADG